MGVGHLDATDGLGDDSDRFGLGALAIDRSPEGRNILQYNP
jgi:hypothetical protein